MKYDVVGIGNALVDIEVQLSDEELSGLDYPKGGMTLSSAEDQLPVSLDNGAIFNDNRFPYGFFVFLANKRRKNIVAVFASVFRQFISH